jgi:hypothetical protein
MKKMIFGVCLIATCAALMVGCATGTHILTGQARSPIEPEQVTLYQTLPAKFEVVGIVNATCPGHSQRNMDDAVEELKKQAAKIGANGIILGAVNPGGQSVGVSTGYGFGGGTSFGATGVGVSTHGIELSGQAIFCP